MQVLREKKEGGETPVKLVRCLEKRLKKLNESKQMPISAPHSFFSCSLIALWTTSGVIGSS